MTIIQAINRIDNLKYNTYSTAEKVAWLSTVDAMVQTQVVNANRGKKGGSVCYDPDTDLDTELLVQAPFDEMYLRWMEAQMDYANGELDKYNNAMEMFRAVFDSYSNWYTRTHMPASRPIRFF